MKHRWIPSMRLGARSRLLAGLSVLALSAGAVGCGGDDEADTASGAAAPTTSESASSAEKQDFSGTTITYIGLGGELDEAYKKAWMDPFSEETGVKFVMDAPVDYAKLATQVEAGTAQWDIADNDPYFLDNNCGKYFEELDVDLSELPDKYQPTSKCGVPEVIYAYAMSNQEKSFPGDTGPQNCKDFFDTEKFPGKRALWNYANAGLFECAAVALGADPANPYPLDLDKIFDLIKSIKDDIKVYSVAAEGEDMILNNDVATGIYPTRTIGAAVVKGAKTAIQTETVARGWGFFGVVKGSKNAEASKAFLEYIAKPEISKKVSNFIPYASPYGGGIGAELDPKLHPFVPTTGEPLGDQGIDIDFKWWGINYDDAQQRWSDFLAGG